MLVDDVLETDIVETVLGDYLETVVDDSVETALGDNLEPVVDDFA